MNIRLITLSSLLSIVVFATPVQAIAQSSSADTTLAQDIISRTNTDRAALGVGSVSENAALSAAAQKKADDMLARQYFSHTSPSGGAPWSFFTKGGYSYKYAAENLAMDFYSADDVEAAWMNSPTHRANIVSSKYKEMGVGIARGTYQGKPVIFIVEFFGTQKTGVTKR